MLHKILEVAFLYQLEVLHRVLQAVQGWLHQPILAQE